MPEAPRRLVILAPNWLGDAVMGLAALADLRRAWPQAHLTVAARPSVAPLFGMVPDVNDTLALAAPAGASALTRWRRDAVTLAAGGFDTAVLFPNSIASALSVWRAEVPARYGFATDMRRRLLTHPAPRPAGGLHQAAYYQALIASMGLPTGPMQARVVAGEAARARAHELLAQAGAPRGGRILALAPGAAYGRAKQWVPSHFARLADLAFAKDGTVSVLVGSAADAPVCRDIAASTRHAIDVSGRSDLPTLAGLLSIAGACVSNDSGAMHLAAAVGTHVVAVFGPTNEHRTAPIGPQGWGGARVVTADAWCRPCMLRECPIDHRCMRRISPAMVMERL